MLSNQDPFVARAVDRIYILERLTLNSLIAEINPGLTQQERETLSVFISASVAGSTMFVGFEKPWSSELPLYSAIASRALVELVRTLKPGQLEAFGWRRQDDAKAGWRTPTLLPAKISKPCWMSGKRVRRRAPSKLKPDRPHNLVI